MGKRSDGTFARRPQDALSYSPDTGVFTWLEARGCRAAGSVAGSANGSGYVHIKFDKKLIKAHRLAWLFVYGDWPYGEVDHVNGDPGDNRIANLRIATRAQNCTNTALYRNNAAGVRGVHRRGNRWRATIYHDKQRHDLGHFDTVEEAASAYAEASSRLHKEFARG